MRKTGYTKVQILRQQVDEHDEEQADGGVRQGEMSSKQFERTKREISNEHDSSGLESARGREKGTESKTDYKLMDQAMPTIQ